MFFTYRRDKDFFSSLADFNHVFKLCSPVNHEEGTHFIESLATLGQLLEEKRLNKEDPVLRFLVDNSGVAWFARETRTGIKAPKHFQMTGESQENACCKTAGNLKFSNTKCRVLKKINHRSGDFRPSFYSLRLFLLILVLNEELLPFKLPRILYVKEFNSEGKTRRKHRWPVSYLRKWVKTFYTDEALIQQLKKQAVEKRKVYYKEVKPHA